MAKINLVAHRGYQKLYPENTLISMAEAIKAGAHYIETDIQLSADREPFLYHDRTMKRLSKKSGAIHDYSSEQLRVTPLFEPDRFGDLHSDQMILSLADLVVLLQEAPHVSAFIEVKRCTLEHHGIETVYQRVSDTLKPVKNQCILMSFSLPFMEHAKSAGYPKIGFVTEFGDQALKKEVVALSPDYIFCDYETMPTKISDFHSEKAAWVIYEINQADTARSLINQGIRFLETFDYVGLKSGLASQGIN